MGRNAGLGSHRERLAHGHGPWHWLVEPPAVFTATAGLLLAAIWVTTLNLTARAEADAERSAMALVADQADTYEAQVVRALREIERTLKLARHDLAGASAGNVLRSLAAEDLLLPQRLFRVAVADAGGNVLTALPATGVRHFGNLGFFREARSSQRMVIGLPRYNERDGQWMLDFALQEVAPRGRVIVISVNAGYFVSGYAQDALGAEGVIGLVGTKGIFRVRRTGRDVVTGNLAAYGGFADDRSHDEATLQTNPWDGVARYTVTRKLFDFPLSIVVGLSRAEQLAPAQRQQKWYLQRASVASVVVLIVLGALTRLSWQLRRERLDHAQQTEHLAYHDNLTNLPNRAYFTRLLQQGMDQRQQHLALLFLDLDRFKAINDSLGHKAGDELLIEVARRLRAAVRHSDIVARLGGDEFVVLLPQIDAEEHVVAVADKVLAAFSEPVEVAGHALRVTVSIGVTIYPNDGTDEQTLMKNADVAMYQAKEQGRNNVQFYSAALTSEVVERLELESSVRRALENGDLELRYRPRRSAHDGHIVAVEGVLRWQHPELGLINPLRCRALADEGGIVVPIGRWMIATACRQGAAWQREGLPSIPVAVALSPRQFLDEALIASLRSALAENGLEPGRLELAVAEAALAREPERTIQRIGAIQALGVRVGLTHFGASPAAVAQLSGAPLATITLDRALTGLGPQHGALLNALTAAGRSLGRSLVAEGVDSTEQLALLRRHASAAFEGYSDAEALAAPDFVALLREPDASSSGSGSGG